MQNLTYLNGIFLRHLSLNGLQVGIALVGIQSLGKLKNEQTRDVRLVGRHAHEGRKHIRRDQSRVATISAVVGVGIELMRILRLRVPACLLGSFILFLLLEPLPLKEVARVLCKGGVSDGGLYSGRGPGGDDGSMARLFPFRAGLLRVVGNFRLRLISGRSRGKVHAHRRGGRPSLESPVGVEIPSLDGDRRMGLWDLADWGVLVWLHDD